MIFHDDLEVLNENYFFFVSPNKNMSTVRQSQTYCTRTSTSTFTFSNVLMLLIGVWILAVTFPSFHYSPLNSYHHSDNSYLIGLTVVGFVNLVAGILLVMYGDSLSINTDGLSGLIGLVSMIALISIVIGRTHLMDEGTSRDAIQEESKKVQNPDGSVTKTTRYINYVQTPSPGYEYIDDAMFGQKSNLSLIGVILLSLILAVLNLKLH